MQTEIVTAPSRDWPWFTKSLVLGGLFMFILLFELAGLTLFGWLGVRGLIRQDKRGKYFTVAIPELPCY